MVYIGNIYDKLVFLKIIFSIMSCMRYYIYYNIYLWGVSTGKERGAIMSSKCGGRSSVFIYKGGNEKRGIRALVEMYFKNKYFLFPDDNETLDKIKNDILLALVYSYIRCSESGYAEDEMIKELLHFALAILGYCSKNEREVWENELNDFYIMMFRHALELGMKYDHGIVVELLVKSGLLEMLSTCIDQLQPYDYDQDLISGYLRDSSISDTDKRMLCFMTHKVCKSVKEMIKINIDELTEDELIIAIRTQYFEGDDKERVNRRLLDLLKDLSSREDMKDKYDSLIKDVINLHVEYTIPISLYSEYMKTHPLYRILYYPETVDYEELDLKVFVNVKSHKIIENAGKYGGYPLYKRIRDVYYKYMGIKFCEAFSQILRIEIYKYLYETERKSKKNKKNKI